MNHDNPPPDRRSLLRWAVHGLSAVFAAVLGLPALAFLIDPRNRPAPQRGFRRVALLSELTINKPKEVVLIDTRTDAWTLYPNDVIGRVFLIKRQGNHVDAYTTTCPHLGCSINFTGEIFRCPCHAATFSVEGTKMGGHNVAPRDMDSLEVNPDALRNGMVEVKYQKFEQGKDKKIVKT